MLFLRSPGGISHHPDETVTRPTSRPRSRRAARLLDDLERIVMH